MSLPFLQNYLGLSSGLQTRQASAGGSVGGWVELGRTTLGSANANITVSSLADKRYYMTLTNIVGRSAITTNSSWRLNADTGSNYAIRYNYDGANEATATSQTGMYGIINHPANTTCLNIAYWANFSTKEKLMMNCGINQNTAGAGTAPARYEAVGKHAQTTNPISTITLNSGGGETFNTGSEVVVLGYDPADTHTTNFWTELASDTFAGGSDNFTSSTFTAKKYLWGQIYIKGLASPAASSLRFRFNADSGSNYADRYSVNGGADNTGTSLAHINASSSDATPDFYNFFIINNSANEKLFIGHEIKQSTTGAGTAPSRSEIVGKWANTSSQITSLSILTNGVNITSGSIMKIWGSN